MAAQRILIVDDEKEIADLVAFYLEAEDYAVTCCYNGIDAVAQIQSSAFDLAILDLMLPDIDGMTLCKIIRQSHHYPIIMLTAKSESIDQITGLAVGADDYVTKPFQPLALVARVKAQLRRFTYYNQSDKRKTPAHLLSLRGLLLNTDTHECLLNEKLLSLTPTEFSILKVLLENVGSPVSSEQINEAVWGDAYFNKNHNSISVHIRNLREKMGDSFENTAYIKTVWGCGYKIE
ncbi:MAG: response regulator transcription factor [Peptococcaceae bacterium]|nr:response regulator transcription factor [Peptococcaceae bacterium]